jgi:hypothetical protein
MTKKRFILGLSILTVAIAGCAGVKGPSWLHPGSTAYQQSQAQRFDPLPANNIAPDVVGARPRDSQITAPEPTQARWPVPGVRN